ncbi:MAG: uncharacterized protein QOK16_3469 [Solirubrobacteraceae bacterium]|nr:uncharacterized protein [Solirubrobacteraceae bacterium]
MSGVLAVIAKTPQPGRSKTRLCPPCTPRQAAALAEAALRDTLAAVGAAPVAARRVLVLDGAPGDWADGFEILAQRGDGLDERLAAAFTDLDGPLFLIGMDTPQLAPDLIADGLRALEACDACLGPAPDGGYWGIGLRDPTAEAVLGVPMSVRTTHAAQAARLRALGRDALVLPTVRDVDTIADAFAVAAEAPDTRFAATVKALDLAHAVRRGA